MGEGLRRLLDDARRAATYLVRPANGGPNGNHVDRAVLAGTLGYVRLARLDHWFKNVLVLPGTAIAAFLVDARFADHVLPLAFGLASACLVASANYVLNEWLDAEFDRFHPLKRNRPSVTGELDARIVWTQFTVLALAGFALSLTISPRFLAAAVALWVMGFVYNVRPLRTKDRVYLDVLSESVNNPIRLAMGWFVVIDDPLPPASLVLGYWMLGAFLMAVKRYAELRFIGSPEVAGRYRRSFSSYTPEKLLISTLFYASSASFFLGVFLVKYRVELLLVLPFLAVAFAWYLQIGMKEASAAQTPERLYRERGFVLYLLLVVALVFAAFMVDVPSMTWFLENAFIARPE